jgi:ribosomal protein L37AE/L43A
MVNEADERSDRDVQQCPSCAFAEVRHSHVRGTRQVWFVCGRCRLSWSIEDRRRHATQKREEVERRAPPDE